MPGPHDGKSENVFFRCDTWLQIFQNDSIICEVEVTVTPLINKICKPWRLLQLFTLQCKRNFILKGFVNGLSNDSHLIIDHDVSTVWCRSSLGDCLHLLSETISIAVIILLLPLIIPAMLGSNPPITSEVCDTPLTNNHLRDYSETNVEQNPWPGSTMLKYMYSNSAWRGGHWQLTLALG